MAEQQEVISNWLPQARVAVNGDLMFPVRGKAPQPIDGYTVDPTDPYIHHVSLKPCMFRKIAYQKVCGGLRIKFDCSHFKMCVTGSDCVQCKERKDV